MIFMPQQISLFDTLQNREQTPAGGGSSKKSFRSYVRGYHFGRKLARSVEGIFERQKEEAGCAGVSGRLNA